METSFSFIDPSSQIGPDCQIGHYCIVEAGAVLEPSVKLGHHVVVHAGTIIGANTQVGDGCILGRPLTPAATSTVKASELPPLQIGKNCILGSHVVIYRGTLIKDGCFFGDYASVREKCKLGLSVLVGRGVAIENQAAIGDFTKIQTNAYITAYTTVEDHVFIGPCARTYNDNFMGRTEKRFKYIKGPTIKRGARVGGGSILLPGIVVGEETFVAAGALVTRDTPPRKLVKGIPARVERDVPGEEIIFSAPLQEDNLPGPGVSECSGRPVPGFDLKRQNILLQEDLRKVLDEVIKKGQFILAENVQELESEIARICGARYGIGVANGSDALYLALLACGVGQGDEVITTPFTFFATAGAIARAGAVPVFSDIDPVTYNLDPVLAASRVTSRTKAILPVHLYGHPADMEPLMQVARANQLKVIEDAAQALGASGQDGPVGNIGDAGCISFFPTKNLGCFGDGGMVVTSDPEIAERVRMLRVHGSRKKYIHEALGCNSRLDEMQAAVLRVKLAHFPSWTERRREIALLYDQLLNSSGLVQKGVIRLPRQLPGCFHVYHQYTLAVGERDRLQQYLKNKGIGSTVYYPLPLHRQEVFRSLGYKEGDFPRAEQAAREVLSLPMFPEMTGEEVDRVVHVICEFWKGEVQC